MRREARKQPQAQTIDPDAPFVTVAKGPHGMTLMAANAAARTLGIVPGLRLADARARVPDMAVFDHQPDADTKAMEAIADWCDRYTPLVARHGRHGLILDMTGALHLFGGEKGLLVDVRRRLGGMGFTVQAAIASHPATARAVARFGAGGSVPESDTETVVAQLPVEALGGRETVTGLRMAGLTTIGLVIAQPRHALAARFGKPLVDALDRLMDRADQPISPRRPVPDCIAERPFAEPMTNPDAIDQILAQLTGDICVRLEETGEGARHFEARFFRVDGAVRSAIVRTGQSLNDADVIMRLMRLRLEALGDKLDPGFGFDLIRLEAHGRSRLQPVAQSFLEAETREADVAALIDQLSIRYGATAITRPVGYNSHVPERAAAYVPAQGWRVEDAGHGAVMQTRFASEPPSRPIRLFDPPALVDVIAEVPDGPPLKFRFRRVLHEVIHAEGPERIAGEWWHEPDAATRDYFKVEDVEGRRFWLYRAGLYGDETDRPRWFMHGLFA